MCLIHTLVLINGSLSSFMFRVFCDDGFSLLLEWVPRAYLKFSICFIAPAQPPYKSEMNSTVGLVSSKRCPQPATCVFFKHLEAHGRQIKWSMCGIPQRQKEILPYSCARFMKRKERDRKIQQKIGLSFAFSFHLKPRNVLKNLWINRVVFKSKSGAELLHARR